MRIIDMHCDTISKIHARRLKGRVTDWNDPTLMVNLPAMHKGGYALQNFALFVDKGEHPFLQLQELLAVFREELAANRDRIRQVTDTGQLLKNEQEGRLSALLTVEEGGVCEGDISNLHFLYEQGVRMMTLTWNYPNELGYPNYSPSRDCYTPDTEHGLTETGFAFVQEMEQLGMIVDVSHLSDAGFYDVLKVAEKPFVASHSNARAVCPWARNLTDDMIRKLAERGGVIGLNYCGDFLRDDRVGQKTAVRQNKNVEERPKGSLSGVQNGDMKTAVRNHSDEERSGAGDQDPAVVREGVVEMESCKGQIPENFGIQFPGMKKRPGRDSVAGLSDVVRHARHMANVGGIECVGLGSDFDGIPPYACMPQAERMQDLEEVFRQGGFTETEIDRIFYGNVFRVYREILG